MPIPGFGSVVIHPAGETTLVRSLVRVLPAVAAVLASLAGCRDQSGVDDSRGPEVSYTPSFLEGAPPQMVSLPAPQQYTTVASGVSIPGFPTPTLVRIEASGDIQVLKNWPPAEAGTEFATIPPPGGNQGLQTMNCYGVVTLWFQWTGTVYLGPCNGPASGSAVLVHGTGSAQRGSPYPGSTPPACGYYPYTPCYSYSGGAQTVTITPVAAQLRASASPIAIVPGDVVTVTASVTPAFVDNIPVPWQVTQWRWVTAAGSTPKCGTAKVCAFQPQVSGTMFVDAIVNGAPQTTAVALYVFPCKTDTAVFDSPSARRGLRDALDSSDANAPNPTDRDERMGHIKCDENGECNPELFPQGPNDNWCYTETNGKPILPGDTVYHSHPFDPDDQSDLIPPSPLCPHISGNGYAFPGPSDSDYQGASGHPFYVVDPRKIYFVPGEPDGGPGDMGKLQTHDRSSCDPLAHPLT
jgi:hypothetical protein